MCTPPLRHPGLPLRPRGIVTCLCAGAGLGLLLAILVQVGHAVWCCNCHVVVPGRVYRSGQPSPLLLQRLTAQHGIRTVINLRGHYTPEADYQEQRRTLEHLRVAQHDFQLSSMKMASAAEAERFVALVSDAPEPILLHCHSGADRTGWAAAVVLLLKTSADLPEARSQLHLRYGHKPFGRVRCWDRFFDQYQGWLDAGRLHHHPDAFRTWLRHAYVPEPAPDDTPWQTIKLRWQHTGPIMGVLDFLRRFLG